MPAYEMRISDWSSDVVSSVLGDAHLAPGDLRCRHVVHDGLAAGFGRGKRAAIGIGGKAGVRAAMRRDERRPPDHVDVMHRDAGGSAEGRESGWRYGRM